MGLSAAHNLLQCPMDIVNNQPKVHVICTGGKCIGPPWKAEYHEEHSIQSTTFKVFKRVVLTLGARVGLLSQQTVSKSQGNGKRTQPITHLASAKQICNLLNQFLCNLLSSVSAWFVSSLLGHVATVSSLGKPQKNSQFTKQIYLQFTVLFVQSVFFQFAEQFNHSLLDSVNQKKNKLVYWVIGGNL